MAPSKKTASDGPATRGRGRPKGTKVAKNPPTATTANSRPRGRPRGATTKAATAATTKAAPATKSKSKTKTKPAPVAKRGRRGPGRPKGVAKPTVQISTVAPLPEALPKGHARYKTLDVFTTEKFQGNPLAVVTLPSDRFSKETRQAVAKEFNFSETTFVTAAKNRAWRVDVFTPFEELPFAGHPTIGTICSLAMDDPSLTEGQLLMKAGPVKFTVARGGPGRSIVTAAAEVPHNMHIHSTGYDDHHLDVAQPDLARLLDDQGRPNEWPLVSVTKGLTFVLVEVPSMEALSKIKTNNIDMASHVALDSDWAPSFVCSYFYYVARSEEDETQHIIHSRMIEKDIGEDAVTGSAACSLAGFLALDVFQTKGARDTEYEITQGEHLGRSGTISLRVSVNEEGKVEKMLLKGESVRVMNGTIDMA